MSLLNRILPWRRSRTQRTWLAGEARATRDALGANIIGLARAMEERFVSLSERIDGLREAQTADATRAAEILGARVDGALNELRVVLDSRLDRVAAQVAALREEQEFARVLRELKRDLGAQISLSSFEVAAEIRNLTAGLGPVALAGGPAGDAAARLQPASGAAASSS